MISIIVVVKPITMTLLVTDLIHMLSAEYNRSVATMHDVPAIGTSGGATDGGTYTNSVAGGVVAAGVVVTGAVVVKEGVVELAGGTTEVGAVVIEEGTVEVEDWGPEVAGVVVGVISVVVPAVVSVEDLQAAEKVNEAMAAPIAAMPVRFKNCRLENFVTRKFPFFFWMFSPSFSNIFNLLNVFDHKR